MTDLDKLIDAVEAGEPSEFRKANRATFSTPCQDMALQLSEEHCRHAFKGSLDSALALHEALLPGWDRQICTYEDATFEASVSHPLKVKTHDGVSHTMARAWLLAILRAYRSVQA